MKKLATITIPACAVAMIAIVLVVEVAVRATWDGSRGTPGLFVSDPVRVEKLSAHYSGWFAGVPVRTNGLAFRDDREYAVEKDPRTLRVLVLGDSVTFGHGSIYEHTYPYLLEQRLGRWKPDVSWEVWNLGVPGYNTTQELAYLQEVGPVYRPDLVVIGFFVNDLVDNRPIEPPTRRAVAASAVKTWFKRHLYSFDWYKKSYLSLRYRLFASATEKELLENLAAQDQLLARPADVAQLQEQRLTNPAPVAADAADPPRCTAPQATKTSVSVLEALPSMPAWKAAVRQLQDLNRSGLYRIVFFVNAAPAPCPYEAEDVFDARWSKPLDDYYVKVLSDGTPAVSSHDAFLRYRPSQMPLAGAHSIGNSNAVKAAVLFEFLRDRVLPAVIARHRNES